MIEYKLVLSSDGPRLQYHVGQCLPKRPQSAPSVCRGARRGAIILQIDLDPALHCRLYFTVRFRQNDHQLFPSDGVPLGSRGSSDISSVMAKGRDTSSADYVCGSHMMLR